VDVQAVRWIESLTIDRPDTAVYLALSDLDEVARWSAWAAVAGGTPAVNGDGTSFGSSLLLRDVGGGEHGQLNLVSARLDQVELHVGGDGAGRFGGIGRRLLDVRLTYRLQDVGASATIVMLDVSVAAARRSLVRHVAERRLRRRLAAVAALDLRQLKAHLEATPAGP
jgi:carbon monoxide dehydrogenase subunit G